MKILLANKFFYLNGGSETVFFQEREYLLNKGYEIADFSMKDKKNVISPTSDCFLPKTDYNKYNRNLAEKIYQAFSFIHSPIAIKSLKELLITYKPDIAHLHNIYHQLTPSIIPVLKKHGVKVVLTLHDYKLTCPSYLSLKGGEICEECSGGKFSKVLTTHCQNSRSKELVLYIEAKYHHLIKSYEGVDLFISPSRFLADQVSWRIPDKKLKILHNGIDPSSYISSELDEGYALYFGRLSKEKGVSTLLRAHQRTLNKLPLRIVGKGPLEEEFRSTYTYPTVKFLGHRTGQELKDLVARSSFVIVPSEWYENCSMAILEAMALGKPIIGSRVGGIPEQIVDGKTGLLFEMGNEIELAQKMDMLTADSQMRVSMGRAARIKLENDYSLKHHCNTLLKIYKKLALKR